MRAELVLVKPIYTRWGKVYAICALIYFGLALDATILPGINSVHYSSSVSAQAPASQSIIPKQPGPPPPAPAVKPPAPAPAVLQPKKAPSSPGNTYWRGYCTWYAKHRRPDLPNNLGHANTWFSRARAQGIPTGSAPAAGAIGQRGMHVVYIERVNSNGTVYISEMNYVGRGVVSNRTVTANSFQYIY